MLEEVYQFLSRVSIPRVVVVDQSHPTGVISRATLLRWFRNWMTARERACDGGSDRKPGIACKSGSVHVFLCHFKIICAGTFQLQYVIPFLNLLTAASAFRISGVIIF